MKKIYLICALVIVGIISILITGCSHQQEDKETIIKYLDDIYGKDTYTMKKDPDYKYNYLVKLKEYPGLQFRITVSHQPLTSSYVWSDFDEVFSSHAIKQFKNVIDLVEDDIEYSQPEFIYAAEVNSLEELKISYDKLMEFIDFVSQKYPILIDTGILDIRFDVTGLMLKGDIESETKYFHVCEVKKGTLSIKSYDELYGELAPKIKTQNPSSQGLIFKADDGRAFALGEDTFEDCLNKGLKLENVDTKELEKITLTPGESSDIYTFSSSDNYNFVNIKIQAKNLTSSDCSLYDATIIKAVIAGGEEIYIDPAWIKLKFNAWDKKTGGKWIDPYDALKITHPKTKSEKTEGVLYKNTKVLFEERNGKDWKEIVKVTLNTCQ